MNSKHFFLQNKHILNYAYCWKPYDKIDISYIRNIHIDLNNINNENNIKNPNFNFKKTGILSPYAKLFYNGTKYTNANIMIIDKFLQNEDNERIKQVFSLENWKNDAILTKEKFCEVNKACTTLYNFFIIID